MSENNFQVDLTNCDREPIHIPGLVQAHGVLIALDKDLYIRQISENCLEHFGRSAENLLNTKLEDLTGAEYFSDLERQLFAIDTEANPHHLEPFELDEKTFEVSAHRYQDVLIIEFELPVSGEPEINSKAYRSLRSKLTEINNAKTIAEFCGRAAETVRDFTGFDRVMIYRFLEDDSGEVIAEAKREDLEPFLGLRYPASDIPKQARELYLKQTLRFMVDVDAVSAQIVPILNPQTDQPIDMSYAATRAMSPIHNEYLKNMNVAASLSISIIKDEKLWGLIACHHTTPRYIPHQARTLGEFLAHSVALQIESKSKTENYEYLAHLQEYQQRMLSELNETQNISFALIEGENNLLNSLECSGAALVLHDEIFLAGATPDAAEIKKLIEWLWKNQEETTFATNHLVKDFPAAEDYSETASGILAVRLTQKSPDYILWFRPEQTQTVKWAGNPEKPVTVGQFGARLTPRKSFEVWQSEVRGQSVSWKEFEIEFADALRRTVVEIILRRINELIELNKELEASNTELDSFAYVASHDLKEPLRGINNYSNFLIEDYGNSLDTEAVERLLTLIRLTERMEVLLDSLLHFSRVGRIDLQKTEIDLNDVLEESLLFLHSRIEETKTEIHIPRPLPIVFADAVRIGEVFTNLISNALKYNDKLEKKIEIGYVENALPNVAGEDRIERIFYVRDNGIGIDARHHADIFRIFKRLHGRNEYSGVGAGLTIVKKIIERHDGRIWVESTVGAGTTVYFTVEQP